MQLSPETQDVKMRSITISESLVSLSGYETYPNTMNGLPNLVNLRELFGINRLNKAVGLLKLIVG